MTRKTSKASEGYKAQNCLRNFAQEFRPLSSSQRAYLVLLVTSEQLGGPCFGLSRFTRFARSHHPKARHLSRVPAPVSPRDT